MNYTTGTVTLTNGSTAVTGSGTGWTTALIVGGVIYPQAAGNPLPIASVDSNTEITAATEWTGATGTYAYALARQDDENQVIANAIALADYIARLGKPSLAAIAGLTPEADKFPYYTGSGSGDLATLTAFARTFLEAGDSSTALTTLGVTPFSRTFLEAGNSSTALTTLGVTPFARTFLEAGNSSTALTTLGVTPFARTFLEAGDSSTALTTLGVTPFSKTLLDDADAAAARQTLEIVQETPGKVAMFAMSSAPAGWLKANGAAVSRTSYADLFSAIGTTFGAGDGSTTFQLPDLRGEFMRGWDDGRGVDSGRNLGSAQGHALQSHSHNYLAPNGANVWLSDRHDIGGYLNSPMDTGSTGGSETRPRNVALLACIKY